MDDNGKLADLLFPHVTITADEILSKYPPRALPKEAMVTRLAPSPTGEVHIGSLYAAFLSHRLAMQSGGVFYVRLDDTDQKREVKGASGRIAAELNHLGITYEEGFIDPDNEHGKYGPYIQSRRKDLYQVFAKHLVKEGKAYPCFLREEELAAIRMEQKRQGADIGCYGPFALHQNLTLSEVKDKLRTGNPFTLRLRSQGVKGRKVCLYDLFKGTVRMDENIQDIVILKSDGLPTYHFAHAVDDHLMHTTHVLRGDEWLSSYPVHRQLFEALGWAVPIYGHLAPIMKKEGAAKRKFSKRKDADGHAAYYKALGVLPLALREYYMRLINSAFEDWRLIHPSLPLEAYAIDLNNFGSSGPVFDMDKLMDISRDLIAGMDEKQILDQLLLWAKEYDPVFHQMLDRDKPYALAILAIGRNVLKPRKDIAKWSDVRSVYGYFFDDIYSTVPKDDRLSAHERSMLQYYAEQYDESLPKDDWFKSLKAAASKFGYAIDKKAYARNPDQYRGTLGDAAGALRFALTGRENSPDLYDVLQVMGKNRVHKRLVSTEKSMTL